MAKATLRPDEIFIAQPGSRPERLRLDDVLRRHISFGRPKRPELQQCGLDGAAAPMNFQPDGNPKVRVAPYDVGQ